jgi:spermidine/putrescine transport system permease protein
MRHNREEDGRLNPLARCFPVNAMTALSTLILIVAWSPVLYAARISLSAASQAALPSGISFFPVQTALNDAAITTSLGRSLGVALTASILSVIFGGVVAVAANVHGRRMLKLLMILYLFPLITPDVMIGLSLGHFAKELSLELDWYEIAIAHSVFGSSLVFYVVSAAYDQKAKEVVEAATVVGLVKIWELKTLLYQLVGRAFFAGAIVAFVVSLDDFAVTYFLTQAGQSTFPVTMFGRLSKGLRPEYFAAAFLFAFLNMALVVIVILKFGLNSFGLKEKEHEAVI